MMKYVVITPAKNEAEYIGTTIQSVVNQTIKPVEFVIVDDGSTDQTYEIAFSWHLKHEWIKVVRHQTTSEERSGGAKVVRAFNYGLTALTRLDYDFIVKLDGDLELPGDYFQSVSEEFEKDPQLGLCGGIILNKYGDKLIQEGGLDYHIRGAFKSIRKKCFEDIKGFQPIWYWDGIDEMHALYLGWKTKTIPKYVVHFRPTTNAYDPVKHAYKCGYEAYRMRNSFILTCLRTVFRITRKPVFVNSYSYLNGYFSAMRNKESFHIDKDLARFINWFHAKRVIKKYLSLG